MSFSLSLSRGLEAGARYAPCNNPAADGEGLEGVDGVGEVPVINLTGSTSAIPVPNPLHDGAFSFLILQLHYVTRRFEIYLCYYCVREGKTTLPEEKGWSKSQEQSSTRIEGPSGETVQGAKGRDGSTKG